ncbi:MAG: dTDP-4-dehydrorhamnose 3,5-epimerase [Aquabacterium sp.]
MRIERLTIPDVVLIEPRVFGDERGHFFESWNRRELAQALNEDILFVQDNQSRSLRGVLRGLHYQLPPDAQGKLVRVSSGVIFDVAVDLRRGSAHFGRWVGTHLDADRHRQLWVPAGFAHGFLVLSESAVVQYKTTTAYAPASERALRWDDPAVAIAWPLDGLAPVLSAKDQAAVSWEAAPKFETPVTHGNTSSPGQS